jgi:pimeloyl-ACP methyl ester carboxylesterase
MGQSTFKSDRRLLDYPDDLAALADEMGFDTFGVLGWSGGGAHTTVCGYALADRLTFNISLCGYTNFAELPGAADMLGTKADRLSVGLSNKYPRLFQFFFDVMAFGAKHFPNLYYQEVARAGNRTDREITKDHDFKRLLLADQREAMIQGGLGVTVDAKIHYVDWGFRLHEIPMKVHVFHGTDDPMVPYAYAKHLAANIPDCELHSMQAQGHLFPWLETHQEMIFQTAAQEWK